MKEKKRLCWLLPVVILLLAAVGWFFWKYTFVDGTVTARSADTIDLRGREISEEKLRTIESRFPDAHILWDVTVGGKSFDGESESIVTADFTTEDIPSFARLKNLKEADVSACSDFSAILALQNALPEVRVHWTVPLGEKSVDGESESIAVQDAFACRSAHPYRRISVHALFLGRDARRPHYTQRCHGARFYRHAAHRRGSYRAFCGATAFFKCGERQSHGLRSFRTHAAGFFCGAPKSSYRMGNAALRREILDRRRGDRFFGCPSHRGGRGADRGHAFARTGRISQYTTTIMNSRRTTIPLPLSDTAAI